MEDDDEFGDLYTDVLRPLTTSFQLQPEEPDVLAAKSRPIDLNTNSDDDEILYGAPESKILNNSKLNSHVWNLNDPIHEKTLPELRGFDLNLNLDSNSEADVLEFGARFLDKDEDVKLPEKAIFLEDDHDINIVVEERETKNDDGEDENFMDRKENTTNFVNESVIGEIRPEEVIPGGLEGQRVDEWESDESEDDLQIVLNDNNQGPLRMDRNDGDDEDGEPLVIVADNGDVHQHMMIEGQEWGGEEEGDDSERKELGDATKSSGGGTAAALAAVQPKVPYNNHVYHHSFHSQFKYVRPGAAPILPGGISCQVRPSVPMGPAAGRGKGDWRPAGVKGVFQPGYGMPVWGGNTAGRGYGSGLDFTLPSHKTIFEVDIDNFEEKPWRLSGIDMSDFFNYGLNEDSWKDYCKQLEQLRLETTMQGKIRVYESGRAEQDYDPDLPPELAAAVGIQDIPSENANPGKADAGPTDLARSIVHGRPHLPVGRQIPVETGAGDRLPSMDTRRPRTHDMDAIIEIFCHSSTDDDEQQDNESTKEELGEGDETDDLHGQKREIVARRTQSKKSLDLLSSPPEAPGEYHPDNENSMPDEERSTRGRGQCARYPEMSVSHNKREKHITDDQNEESFDSEDVKQTPPLSSSPAIGSDGDQDIVVKDESVTDDPSFDTERVEITVEGDNLFNSRKKEKLSQESDNGEDSKTARSSENSKGRSGSSKDNRRFIDNVGDEVLQDRRRPPRGVDFKRPVEDENNARRKGHHVRDETERHHMVKGREDSYSRRGGNLNSSLRRKDSDISEGSWHRRDEDHHGRRIRVEETRNRGKVRESRSENVDYYQSRNQLDNNGSWRMTNNDQYMGSRERDRNGIVKRQNIKAADFRSKRMKEEVLLSREHTLKEDISHNHIESNLRKRGRDKDDHARLKDDNVHYVRQKEEVSFQRERIESDEWHRHKQEEILSRSEREDNRPITRSGRAAEDKTWISHSRGKEDYKGSGREHLQLKRRNQVEISQHRGHEDVYARGDQLTNDEKRARYERPPGTRDERVAYASDTSRVHEHKQRESSRKSKGSESGDHIIHSKRNQNEHSGWMRETVNLIGKSEQQSGQDVNRQSSRKQKEKGSSDDEQEADLRKGRSKLERWTSHKERDFTITASMSSSSLKNNDIDSQNKGGASFDSSRIPKEPPKRMEEKPQPLIIEKDTAAAEMNNNNNDDDDDVGPKEIDDNNKHLDTVEKLKKRSERFKLPMPSEKDGVAIKKMENEALPSAHNETRMDSEIIKSERPPRKRRWTGK